MNIANGYEQLADVLQAAHDQAAHGKGAERHANDLPFHEQRMQTIAQLTNSDRGMVQQVIKKTLEGTEFTDHDRREAELLGAINYLAGIVIFHRNRQHDQSKPNWPESAEKRAAAIMQNGNEGEHYEQDMADPSNWRKGDIIEALSSDRSGLFCEGELYKVIASYADMVSVVLNLDGTRGEWLSSKFKWISRPEESKPDMTDPENWQAGDELRYLAPDYDLYAQGGIYIVSKPVTNGVIEIGCEYLGGGAPNTSKWAACNVGCFEWLSRPDEDLDDE